MKPNLKIIHYRLPSRHLPAIKALLVAGASLFAIQWWLEEEFNIRVKTWQIDRALWRSLGNAPASLHPEANP